MPLPNENKKIPSWVALNLALGDNIRLLQKVINHFPSVDHVFRAPLEEFRRLGMEKKYIQRLLSPHLIKRTSKEIARCDEKGYTILTLEDPRYPERLREIFDPPPVIYCGGTTEVLSAPAVALVGARRPSPYGQAVTERLARDLARSGLIVVSGMARGIDSLAHWGALKGGKTVAVLGSGLEKLYPRENKDLSRKIINTGAVITEFPLDSPPLGFHFPMRNRIISGLAIAVVVIEATKKSGSLITGRLALEQNREVMAVPGNITSDLSQGTNWLIRSGAKPVGSWKDVVEEFPSPLRETFLGSGSPQQPPPNLSGQEKDILECLHPDNLTHIDEIIESKNLAVSELLPLLLSLELKDMISQRPGKYYYRKM